MMLENDAKNDTYNVVVMISGKILLARAAQNQT